MGNVLSRVLPSPPHQNQLPTVSETLNDFQGLPEGSQRVLEDPRSPNGRRSSAVRYCVLEETTVTDLDRHALCYHHSYTDADLPSELREARTICGKLRAEVAREQRRVRIIQTEAEDRIAQLSARLQYTEQALAQERGRNQGLREEVWHLREASQDCSGIQSQLQRSQGQVAHLRQALRDQDCRLETLQRVNSQLETEKAKWVASSVRVAFLEKELEVVPNLRNELAAANELILGLRREEENNTKLRETISELRSQRGETLVQLEDAKILIHELKERISSLTCRSSKSPKFTYTEYQSPSSDITEVPDILITAEYHTPR